jgi:hypothetical protein
MQMNIKTPIKEDDLGTSKIVLCDKKNSLLQSYGAVKDESGFCQGLKSLFKAILIVCTRIGFIRDVFAQKLAQRLPTAPELINQQAIGRDRALHLFNMFLKVATHEGLVVNFLQVLFHQAFQDHMARHVESIDGVLRESCGVAEENGERGFVHGLEPAFGRSHSEDDFGLWIPLAEF